MKRQIHSKHKGFTLIELSVALTMGLMTGGMVLALFNQQLAFLKVYHAQNFLTEEAPVISTYVSRVIGRADRYRLHASVADALGGTNARLTSSPVVVLNFRQPDGTMRASILAFENLGTGSALYYYVVPSSGQLGSPQWAVTSKPTNVSFAVEQGVLRMSLTGPAGEQITYSGTMQQ
jgi:prepilin-type N-terminal cleavage/methylation domain-containing protein